MAREDLGLARIRVIRDRRNMHWGDGLDVSPISRFRGWLLNSEQAGPEPLASLEMERYPFAP
jgi:hypothetical protein